MAISPEKGGNSVSSWSLMDPLSLIFGEPFRNAGAWKRRVSAGAKPAYGLADSMLSCR
jgi:hypothetical protein